MCIAAHLNPFVVLGENVCAADRLPACLLQAIRHLEANRRQLQLPLYVAHGTKDAVTDVNVSTTSSSCCCSSTNSSRALGRSMTCTVHQHTAAVWCQMTAGDTLALFWRHADEEVGRTDIQSPIQFVQSVALPCAPCTAVLRVGVVQLSKGSAAETHSCVLLAHA